LGRNGSHTRRIRAAGGRAIALEADLTDDATEVRLFDVAEAELGPVDLLLCRRVGY
jgi:3-oxoacyl-[acyl-carrier protein] reductase